MQTDYSAASAPLLTQPVLQPPPYFPQPPGMQPVLQAPQYFPPPQQQMGYEGVAPVIAYKMVEKHHFTIIEVIKPQGCCYTVGNCCNCNNAPADRGYIVIGDTFTEQNAPYNGCCCCCPRDSITKHYYDGQVYAPSCCGEGGFATEDDLNYCCFCIPCTCWYNCCVKPCWGGFVARVSCPRDSCGFLCVTRYLFILNYFFIYINMYIRLSFIHLLCVCVCVRVCACFCRCCSGCSCCCMTKIFEGLADSNRTAGVLQERIDIFRARSEQHAPSSQMMVDYYFKCVLYYYNVWVILIMHILCMRRFIKSCSN